MIYTHTIGRIGKDCKTITGAHGTFIAVDMAVDDYSKGQNITCVQTTIDEWQQLMKGARKASYKRLVQRIKHELPDLYDALALNFYNPYWEQCQQTKTHYILVSSAIEYFIHK